ncbi:MAG TPA: cohesin domain-containing protein [Burkholderiales bacterium]|nr:cohesin domain-containing protein [Burkholderiales bacterium]
MNEMGGITGVLTLIVALTLLASCATRQPKHEDALALMAQGRYEEGIALLERDVRDNPGDFKNRTDLINARERALNRLLAEAADARSAGDFDRAVRSYRRALGLDPGNERARIGLVDIERDRAHVEDVAQARKLYEDGDTEGAALRVQSVLREDPAQRQAQELKRRIEERRARELASVPTLHSMYDGPPLTMKFRDADLRQVFDVLSRESGVTIVFDRDVRPDLRATIVARQIAFEDAFDLLLMSNQLDKKIINRNTVLVYPVTAEKLRQYQDLAVKGFYLTYADVKQTAELLKAVLKPTEMFVDEKMNMIVLRDTPEAISIAEKLIAMHDLVAPEVMLDLEVLEVQRNRLEEMGIQWPNQLTLSPLPANGQATTLRDITGITAATTQAQLAAMIINLRKETGVANLLANPRVRSLNHQKANILIGSKVPVVTTTATATGFASQSVQYLDVGLKLEVEPSIHLQDEVEIKLALEVSSIASQVQVAGVLTYQIGTRNASTVLRMHDSETQVLAGLINDQDTRNSSGVPGLGDIPVVGRLFRSQKDDSQKTEIVLLVTPHLVRNMNVPHATASEFLSGSEMTPKNPVRATAASARKSSDAVALAPVPETAQAASGEILLDWNGPRQAKVGEEFRLALVMNAASPLKNVPMQLEFDPSALEVVSISEGGFFKSGKGRSAFVNHVDASGGRISVGVSGGDAAGATGQGELASIVFRARTPRPQSEVRVLSVAAMAPTGTSASVAVPTPYTVSIGK